MADGGHCEPPIDRRSSQPTAMRCEGDGEAADGEARLEEGQRRRRWFKALQNPNCVLGKKKKKTQLKLGQPMGQIQVSNPLHLKIWLVDLFQI